MKKIIFALALFAAACQNEKTTKTDWGHYLGSPGGTQYTPLTQITKKNVHQLQVAWTYHSGGADTVNQRSQIQCNPLIIDGVLYGTSARLDVFALDAATGLEIWKFSPGEGGVLAVNRGLAWWQEKEERRLFCAVGQFLYALDPVSGELITTFGDFGKVNVHEGLGPENVYKFVTANTPGVVYKDLYILGARVDEESGAAPGHIRAFDVRTGKVRWIFHTIPQPGEFGYDTWEDPEAWKKTGGANAWAGMALDEEAGIVYIPTGSAAYDFWGGDRKGDNLFANCLIALDANTGKRIWHFQTIHHDLWDRDIPAPPTLLTVTHYGKKIKAVAQTTKTGYVFLFDRLTGEPLFPIEEQPVPPSDLAGEKASPTQPRPLKPAPYVRQVFDEKDINPYSPDKDTILATMRRIRNGNMWTPPNQQGLMIFPGFDGGGEWGGAAASPEGILYVNANEMPWVQRMIPTTEPKDAHPGQLLFHRYCATCHGWQLEGDAQGAFPALHNVHDRLTQDSVARLFLTGRNRMPSYQFLSGEEREALVAFLYKKNYAVTPTLRDKLKPTVPFKADGYNRFLDSKKMPAIAPPWGTLSAIDLNTGEYRWQVPLGDWDLENMNLGITGKRKPTGAENYGGPVVTANGLLFIAATRDEKFRAIDAETGTVLWETQLPAGGYATPAMYAVNGKQYVVIACGGGKMGTKSGDAYVAFALP
jgi:quinoprotein glucose dehydrogenase